MIRWCDRGALLGMAAGAIGMLWPAFPGGFRAGFFLLLAATVAHIVTSRYVHREAP